MCCALCIVQCDQMQCDQMQWYQLQADVEVLDLAIVGTGHDKLEHVGAASW